MASKKTEKKTKTEKTDERRPIAANPNLPGEAAQVAGMTRDEGFGGRGGGTGDSKGGVGTLPAGRPAAEHGSPTGETGSDHPAP